MILATILLLLQIHQGGDPIVTPYYRARGVTIYHADAREVLPQLNSQSVDLVLTDPPYGIQYTTKYPNARPIAGDDSLNTMRDVMPALDRLLKPDRHAYFFARSEERRVGKECRL